MNELKTAPIDTIIGFFEKEKRITGLAPDTDLFAGGYVNSLFALEMVVFIEKTFKLKIPRKEITKANFTTPAAMAALVERLSK